MYIGFLGLAMVFYVLQRNARSKLEAPMRRQVVAIRMAAVLLGLVAATFLVNWNGGSLADFKMTAISAALLLLLAYAVGEQLVRRRLLTLGIAPIEGPRGPLY